MIIKLQKIPKSLNGPDTGPGGKSSWGKLGQVVLKPHANPELRMVWETQMRGSGSVPIQGPSKTLLQDPQWSGNSEREEDEEEERSSGMKEEEEEEDGRTKP